MEFHTPAGLHQPFGYSHAVSVEAGRRLVYVSGQIGMTPDGAVVAGWEGQARQAFTNLGVALAAAGAGWADVVKLTYFVTQMDGLPELRAIRDEFVVVERPPASTLVQVAGLFRPEVLIEIEAVAAVA